MLKIYIIDDEILVTNSLKKQLKKYSVDVENDGNKAIEYLNSNANNYDIIIIDINLKVCSGIDIIKLLRTNIKYTDKILVITGTDIYDKEELFTNGADDLLIKPFSGHMIRETIQKITR